MSNLSGFVKRLRDIMRNDAGINGDAQRIEQIAWMLFLKVYDAKEQDWAFDDERYVVHPPGGVPLGELGARRQVRQRHDRRQAAWLRQQHALSRTQGQGRQGRQRENDRRGHPGDGADAHQKGHRADRVRGRQPVHEGRRAAAAGHQRHRRAGFVRLRGEPRLQRNLRGHSQGAAKRRLRGRVLHAPRRDRLHGAG